MAGLRQQLARVGNNVNQLARAAHRGRTWTLPHSRRRGGYSGGSRMRPRQSRRAGSRDREDQHRGGPGGAGPVSDGAGPGDPAYLPG
ncbi:plasmid mobilization relaxosome protein MobC [Tomitella cavernea]|uniref:plasmid mobilization relaxosome protein MobC n=1 Tax=Tomitella cavernea TaxID=1387982 RepID=UPI003CD08771